jgi:lysophospholipase L1-like esterase
MDRAEAVGGARRTALWAPIVLVVCGLVAGVALTEICYRLMRRFVCVGAPSAPLWQSDERYGWGHRPHGEGWWYSCLGRRFEWRVYSKINSHGLRDPEHAYEKPAGTERVLLLGDSITEGLQVPLEDTFARLLESDLRARGLPVEVVNGGVAAFGTDNELEFFRAEGMRYSPDLVVLVFNVVNDVAENSPVLHARVYSRNPEYPLPKTYFHLDSTGRLVADAPSRPAAGLPAISLWKEAEARLYLVRALHRLVSRPSPVPLPAPTSAPLSAIDLTPYDVEMPPPDQLWSNAWQVTEALIRALRTDVEKSGARFAVAVVPSREAVSPAVWQNLLRQLPSLTTTPHDPAYPIERITKFLEDEGIPHLDLLPALRNAAERSGETGYFAWDVHLDVAGHAVVAHALAPFVASLVNAH